MMAVIQRVLEAEVSIEGQIYSQIGKGLLVLLGIGHNDSAEDIAWLSKKIVQMRIFGDTEGKMNLSLQDVDGELLLVSQFTLLASTKKGNRPSYTAAAVPAQAIPLYEAMIQSLQEALGKEIATGQFGADMQVRLLNDGPVTIVINSQDKQ
jgi:D-tyrosyl-tRNA(Tyr) deacylase